LIGGFFKEWLDILLYKTKPEDIADTTLAAGLMNLTAAGIVFGLVSGIYAAITLVPLSWFLFESPPPPAILSNIDIQSTAATIGESIIGTPISDAILMLLVAVIYWLSAKILGGKGSLANHAGALCIGYAAVRGTAVSLLAIVDIAGAVTRNWFIMGITFPIAIALTIYLVFLFASATQAVHQVSRARALLITALAIVAYATLFTALEGILYARLFN